MHEVSGSWGDVEESLFAEGKPKKKPKNTACKNLAHLPWSLSCENCLCVFEWVNLKWFIGLSMICFQRKESRLPRYNMKNIKLKFFFVLKYWNESFKLYSLNLLGKFVLNRGTNAWKLWRELSVFSKYPAQGLSVWGQDACAQREGKGDEVHHSKKNVPLSLKMCTLKPFLGLLESSPIYPICSNPWSILKCCLFAVTYCSLLKEMINPKPKCPLPSK